MGSKGKAKITFLLTKCLNMSGRMWGNCINGRALESKDCITIGDSFMQFSMVSSLGISWGPVGRIELKVFYIDCLQNVIGVGFGYPFSTYNKSTAQDFENM